MLKIITRNLSTATTKNDKVMRKILKYQLKIKNLIIENNLPMTGYTYSYSFHNKKFDEKEYIQAYSISSNHHYKQNSIWQ
jgi:hypothetical protein